MFQTLQNQLVLTFAHQRCIIQTDGQPGYALHGERVIVAEYPDLCIELLHGEETLLCKVFGPARTPQPPVNDKTLDARAASLLKQRRWSGKSRPAANHPWQ